MYNELSKETGDFFSYMRETELMDLVAKREKPVVAIVLLSKIIKHHLFSQTLMALQAILMS